MGERGGQWICCWAGPRLVGLGCDTAAVQCDDIVSLGSVSSLLVGCAARRKNIAIDRLGSSLRPAALPSYLWVDRLRQVAR